MEDRLTKEWGHWVERADWSLQEELRGMKSDHDALADAFYRDLAFGTGGLRGTMGAGTNRMNVHTVARATQGLADYLNTHFQNPSVAIAHDSRHNGELFSRITAGVLAANGIHAYLYPRLEPTPALSFAVRHLDCTAGVCVTASHNPREYNGYKVYNQDGCQITTEAAIEIQAAIDRVDIFDGVRLTSFDEGIEAGHISWIDEECLDAFVNAVLEQSIDMAPDTELNVVYTPLNGTGLELVSRVLDAIGSVDVTPVPEQAMPDGDFPTCPYPNPEIREALQKGLDLCEGVKPDILLATDPDADRCGIAVRHDGSYELLTGNQVGVLLADYIAKAKAENGDNLADSVVVTTIVSSAMVDELAKDYGFQVRRTLTGFKFIGEQVGLLDQVGEDSRFMLGFEESYGYLRGSYVRDKDAVVAAMLICQMARYHKSQKRDLVDAMDELYARYGYYCNGLVSISFPGAGGASKMEALMDGLHSNPPAEFAGLAVIDVLDYLSGLLMPMLNGHDDKQQTLPSADVVELRLEGGSRAIFRPSGTEPKAKAYLFARGDSLEEAKELLAKLENEARSTLVHANHDSEGDSQ